MKKIYLVLLMLVSLNLFGITPNKNFTFLPNNDYPSFSFMKNQNIDISHSISCMTSVGSQTSFYQSVYTNHINYKLNDKLDLKVNLNFVNNGSFDFNDFDFEGHDNNKSQIIPEFQLNYQPTENMTIKIQYSNGNRYNRRNSLFE